MVFFPSLMLGESSYDPRTLVDLPQLATAESLWWGHRNDRELRALDGLKARNSESERF